ncbi:hypothetical protein P7H51_09490, partial [Vagococcus lutrae]|nr:hypothetical protein [Vagococcus lutrae]
VIPPAIFFYYSTLFDSRFKTLQQNQFSFKPEMKNADDFYKGQREDIRKKLFNIEHNSELTQEEKWLAKDRVLGLKLGTHEADFFAQQEKENAALEEEKARKELLEDLSRKFS